MNPTRLTPLLLSALIPLPLPAPPTIPPPEQEEQAAPEDQDILITAAELEQILIDRATTISYRKRSHLNEVEPQQVNFQANNILILNRNTRVHWDITEIEDNLILIFALNGTPQAENALYLALTLSENPTNNHIQFHIDQDHIETVFNRSAIFQQGLLGFDQIPELVERMTEAFKANPQITLDRE